MKLSGLCGTGKNKQLQRQFLKTQASTGLATDTQQGPFNKTFGVNSNSVTLSDLLLQGFPTWGTFKGSNRREKYIYILFISKLYAYISEYYFQKSLYDYC